MYHSHRPGGLRNVALWHLIPCRLQSPSVQQSNDLEATEVLYSVVGHLAR